MRGVSNRGQKDNSYNIIVARLTKNFSFVLMLVGLLYLHLAYSFKNSLSFALGRSIFGMPKT